MTISPIQSLDSRERRPARRGQSSVVIMLGIFLIVVIILLTILYAMGVFVNQFQIINACKLSISAAGKLNIDAGIASKSITNINCARTTKTIGFNDAFTKHQFDQDKVSHILAEQLRTCWYETGEGKLNPYSSDGYTSKKNCLICSEIKFDNTALKQMDNLGIPKQINDFGTYFTTTEMGPGDFGPANITYANYINDYKVTFGGPLVSIIPDEPGLVIPFLVANFLTEAPSSWFVNSPAEPAFTKAKTAIPMDNLVVAWVYNRKGTGTTAISNDYSTLVIMPARNIGDLQCDNLVN